MGAHFNHPHVIKLFEYLDNKELIFVVFEYVQDGELFDLISQKEYLSEGEARKYFQ